MHGFITFQQCLKCAKVTYTPSVPCKVLNPQSQVDTLIPTIGKVGFQVKLISFDRNGMARCQLVIQNVRELTFLLQDVADFVEQFSCCHRFLFHLESSCPSVTFTACLIKCVSILVALSLMMTSGYFSINSSFRTNAFSILSQQYPQLTIPPFSSSIWTSTPVQLKSSLFLLT